ncbi:MAG: hypothetical protein D6724_07290 [Armatimonadetes bacterium]|nr:MAG: hypothetical protein D6724_07290 [Armatimonadota bacterium]
MLSFVQLPEAMWKGLRSTNSTENLTREFRRKTKTHGSLSTADAGLNLLYGLAAYAQITLPRVTGTSTSPSRWTALGRGSVIEYETHAEHAFSFSTTSGTDPPDDVKKVLDPHFSTKRDGLTTARGIALTNATTIVPARGGEIELESEEGKETTFRIYLPLTRSDERHRSGGDKRTPRRRAVLLSGRSSGDTPCSHLCVASSCALPQSCTPRVP